MTFALLSSVHDSAYRGQVFTAAVPTKTDSRSVIVKVIVSRDQQVSTVDGTISANEKGDLELKIDSKVGLLPTKLEIQGTTLVVTL